MTPATTTAVASEPIIAQQLESHQQQQQQQQPEPEQLLEEQRQRLEQAFKLEQEPQPHPQQQEGPHLTAAPDFSMQGPFQTLTRLTAALMVQLDGAPCKLKLHVTAPNMGQHMGLVPVQAIGQAQAPAAQAQGPTAAAAGRVAAASLQRPTAAQLPLLLLLNGFQMPLSYYTTYARRIASWGYVVLQYNLPGMVLRKIVRDDIEIAALPQLIAWVQDQSQQPGSPLYGAVDVQRLGVMGHSRGAKLAALLLAGATRGYPPGLAPAGSGNIMHLIASSGLNVSTAVLIDPVDMSDHTRKMGYPSAVDALQELGAKAAVIGGRLISRCNPAAEGFQAFWRVLGSGSWQAVVQKAGHMQFTDASGPAGWALDRLCGAGPCSHQEVMGLTAAVSVAWLQNHFRPGSDTSAGLDRFLRWTQEQQQQGLMSFEPKQAQGKEV